jgi:hypothetical protein
MNMPVAARPWARIVRRTSEISEMTELMSFKQKLQQKRAILVPSAPNALTARVITDLGFEAIYVTGTGVTNMSLGLPDLSFVDLSRRSFSTLRQSVRPHRQGKTFPTPIRDNVSANPISGFLQHDVKDLMRSM